jgi:hypothetical protein
MSKLNVFVIIAMLVTPFGLAAQEKDNVPASGKVSPPVVDPRIHVKNDAQVPSGYKDPCEGSVPPNCTDGCKPNGDLCVRSNMAKPKYD